MINGLGSARSELADSDQHVYQSYERYLTCVYVELILAGQYHSINNRVERNTRKVLTRAGNARNWRIENS